MTEIAKFVFPNSGNDFEALAEVGTKLTSTLQWDELVAAIRFHVEQVMSPSHWTLFLIDESVEELHAEILSVPGQSRSEKTSRKVGEGISGWVAQHLTPVIVRNPAEDPRCALPADPASHLPCGSVMAVPLVARKKLVGVFELARGPGETAFSLEDQKALSLIANYAAVAIDNARSFQRVSELTVTDDLTELYNARYMHGVLDQEVARAQRYHAQFSVIFLDLDHFKVVNDTHGHLNGSRLLKEVADVIKTKLRRSDVAVRYGGDEFVVLLPETSKEEAYAVAERLREGIAETEFLREAGLQVRISGSFGLASFPSDARTKDELLRLADDAMYEVKKADRDGVAMARERQRQ